MVFLVEEELDCLVLDLSHCVRVNRTFLVFNYQAEPTRTCDSPKHQTNVRQREGAAGVHHHVFGNVSFDSGNYCDDRKR